jgi:hypothetical protein
LEGGKHRHEAMDDVQELKIICGHLNAEQKSLMIDELQHGAERRPSLAPFSRRSPSLRKTVEAIMDQSDRHESKFKKQNLKRLQTSREMLGKRIAARRVLRDSRQLIKKTEIFKHLSDESIKKVIDAMKYQTFRDQTHLVTQGKVGNELMVIMHGTAIVVRHGKTISKVGSLDVIGEPALVNDDHIRTATVQATSGVGVLSLSKDRYDEFLLDGTIGETVDKHARRKSRQYLEEWTVQKENTNSSEDSSVSDVSVADSSDSGGDD